MRQTLYNQVVLACMHWVYFSSLVAGGTSGSNTVSWLMRHGRHVLPLLLSFFLSFFLTVHWKVLYFSLVGHELKVGHKTRAHNCSLKKCDVSVFCFMAEVKFGFEQSKLSLLLISADFRRQNKLMCTVKHLTVL